MSQSQMESRAIKSSKSRFLIHLVSLILLLSACAPTRSIENALTQAPHTQTATISPSPSPSPTHMPTATFTPEPTPTPTPYANKEVWLAFYGNETGLTEKETYLYVGNIFDREFIPVVEVDNVGITFDGLSVSWSRDAKKIAYVDRDEERFKRINVLDLETGEKNSLVTFPEKDILIKTISWENNASTYLIVETTIPGNEGLYLLDVDTKQSSLIGKHLYFTGWQTDARSFTYRDNGSNGIYQYYPETGQASLLFKYPRMGKYKIGDIELSVSTSPVDFFLDSKSFVSSSCLADQTTGKCSVGVCLLIPSEGDGTAKFAWMDPEDLSEDFIAKNPSLSPDGKWVTYYYWNASYLFDIEKSEAHVIAPDGPGWTLDWYEDSSAFILLDVGPYPEECWLNCFYVTLRVIQTDSLEDLFTLTFNENSEYFLKIKVVNHHWHGCLAMDTIFIESGSMPEITAIAP